MISSTAQPADVVDEKQYKPRLVSIKFAKKFHGNGFLGGLIPKLPLKLPTQNRANVAQVFELSKLNHRNIDNTVTEIKRDVVSASERLERLEAKIELILQRTA